PCAPCITLPTHCLPDFAIGVDPLISGTRTMQQEAVDVVCPKMFERTSQRLRHLESKRRRRIIRQPIILPALISKLCLQKKIQPRNNTSPVRRRQSFPNSSLEIMLALVGRIDRAKPGAQSQFRKPSSAIFLPGGSIEKCRRERCVKHDSQLCHAIR